LIVAQELPAISLSYEQPATKESSVFDGSKLTRSAVY